MEERRLALLFDSLPFGIGELVKPKETQGKQVASAWIAATGEEQDGPRLGAHDELELRVTAFAKTIDNLRGRGHLYRRAIGYMDLERCRGRVGNDRPVGLAGRGSKAEQAPNRRLIVDQLTLGRLRDLMGARAEVAQLRSSTQVVKQFGVALKLGEVIGVQDDRLDVLSAVALDHKRLSQLWIGQTDIVALDDTGHRRKPTMVDVPGQIEEDAVMYVRAVRFTDVSTERMQELLARIEESDGPPPGVAAKGLKILFDDSQGTAVVLQYFESAEDMEAGAQVFSAMDPSETPGTRASVDMCEVKLERTLP